MEMISIFVTALNAVTPVVLLILLGYLLKQSGFLSKDFVKTGNKLVFNVCLPCMLFINVYDIEGFSSINWDIVLYCVAMLLIVFAFGFFLFDVLIDLRCIDLITDVILRGIAGFHDIRRYACHRRNGTYASAFRTVAEAPLDLFGAFFDCQGVRLSAGHTIT